MAYLIARASSDLSGLAELLNSRLVTVDVVTDPAGAMSTLACTGVSHFLCTSVTSSPDDVLFETSPSTTSQREELAAPEPFLIAFGRLGFAPRLYFITVPSTVRP